MQPEATTPPAPASPQELARLLDESRLVATLTDENIESCCRMALDLGLAALLVRPSDVELAARLLAGTATQVASVAGYPHGASTTAVKLYEVRDLLRRGAREVEVVLNTGKLRSRQFQHVETELLQIVRACQESGATAAAAFDHDALAPDLRLIAIKIARRCDASRVSAHFAAPPAGAELAELTRLLKGTPLRLAAPLSSVAEVLAAHASGAARLAVADAAAILAGWPEWASRQAAAQPS